MSSIVLDTEAHRAAARFGPDVASRADRLLARITLVPLNLEVRALARTVHPWPCGHSTPIHLATAVTLGASPSRRLPDPADA